MFRVDKTDQTLMSVSVALILACLVIFLTIADQGQTLFFYLFGAIVLLIFAVTSIVMAGMAYSMGKDGGDIKFVGKGSLLEQFCKISEQDMTFLMAVMIVLVVILLVLNSIPRYMPFFNK